MDLHLEQYFQVPIDYSEAFTTRVSRIATRISQIVGADVLHDADMNYRAAQSLQVFFDKSGMIVNKGKGAVELRIYVSSKGPLFALYLLNIKLTSLAYGLLMESGVLPSQSQKAIQVIVEALEQEFGLVRVPPESFRLPASGCVTELDALPATIFECLFAEMV